MRHELKKVGKIIDELVTFFLSHSGNKIELKIENLADRIDMIFIVENLNENDKVVKMVLDLINLPREEDFDEMYWSLTGESDHDTEFSLIGYMVDDVNVKREDDRLIIHLTRLK